MVDNPQAQRKPRDAAREERLAALASKLAEDDASDTLKKNNADAPSSS